MMQCHECSKSIKNKNVKLVFCSTECTEIYSIQLKDELTIQNNNEIEQLTNELEQLKSDIIELKNEYEYKYEKKYDEGFFNGLTEGIQKHTICPYCKKNIIESIHHIIPRKYKGNDTLRNLIAICNPCHNIVEEYTDQLFKTGKEYSSDILREFINKQTFPNQGDVL